MNWKDYAESRYKSYMPGGDYPQEEIRHVYLKKNLR